MRRLRRACWHRYAYAGCNSSDNQPHVRPSGYHSRSHGSGGSANFGVRRPLRYLRYHLDLDDGQTRRMASTLNRLKLEREQSRVDAKRANHAVADLLTEDKVTLEQAKAALHARVASAERLQTELARTISEVSEMLDDDQREQFAELVRSGVISL